MRSVIGMASSDATSASVRILINIPSYLPITFRADMTRKMIDAQETFGGTWPFKAHYFDGNGFRMHYVDEGAGEALVCLHGEPTWGYLYRRFIGPLSRTHRVVVPDHMGFGKSETPRDR